MYLILSSLPTFVKGSESVMKRYDMKRLLYVPILVMILLGCKSNENDSVAVQSAALQSLVGKWLMTETEQIINGKLVWTKAATLTPVYLSFSPEGVPLDSDGLAFCCAPNELYVNGSNIKIDQKAKLIYFNEACAKVNCISCPTMDIEQSGNEIIVSYCQGARIKYVRN
jgi:hypothetical protein